MACPLLVSRIVKRLALAVIGVLLVWSLALAQAGGPAIASISGSLTPGSTVTIAGSNFGTKPSAAPLKWDNFERGADGSKLSGWTLDASDPSAEPTYSAAVKRPNSAMSARSNFVNGNWDSNFGITGTALPRIYLDAWYYYDVDAPYGRNHKPFRIKTNTGLPNMYYGFWCNNSPGGVLDQDGMTAGNFSEYTGVGGSGFSKKWTHIQGYFEESSPGVDDGTAILSFDGETIINVPHAFRTRASSSSFWNTIWLGHYFGHESDSSCAAYGDAHTYWDDVYLDTTQARVEIGDAPIYANARHREIQVPTSWSATSIGIVLNRGAFAGVTGQYLFVIDASGRASAGYLLGGSAPPPDTTPPTVVAVTPAAASTTAYNATAVTARFSEAVNASTVTSTSFTLRSAAGAAVPAVVSYDAATFVASLQPSAPLTSATAYTATVNGGSGGVKDTAGNALAASYGWTFTTSATNGLVAAYGFEEGTGSGVADSSGNNNVGTIAGATRVPGRFGAGLAFSGSNASVSVPSSPTLNLTTGMTLEAWVNPSALTGWRTVVLKPSATDLAYALYASDGTRPVGVAMLGTKTYDYGTASLTLNAWSHVAATYDGAALKLYVNGTLVKSTPGSGAIATAVTPLQIGGNTVWGEYFAGIIDDVRVYNHALSAAEIQADLQTAVGSHRPAPPLNLRIIR